MSKTIFRTEKNADNPFVMIDRRPIENPSLSWKAKGILAYLLSRPDNWIVRLEDLVNRSSDGPTAIRAAIKELKKLGHVTQKAEYENGRIKQYVFTVHELPLGNLHAGNLKAENLNSENRTLNNTKLTKNEFNDIERYTAIAKNLENLTGALKGTDAPLISAWVEKHTDEWIDKALEIAKAKGARSSAYVDRILIGWEANGYPKTREQQIAERKAEKKQEPKKAADTKRPERLVRDL